jgi:glucose-6-phosphate 1-dehydrogenase
MSEPINRLLLFGASGDLVGRFILPALSALRAAGKLGDDFEVVGAARESWSDEEFRDRAAERLADHAAGVPADARAVVLRALRYRAFDFGDRASVEALVNAGDGPLAAYLALPTGVFPAAIAALDAAGLPAGSRIVLEKPFGENLGDAVELNSLLARVGPDAGPSGVFRVDHVLGMATTQNLIGMRAADGVLEPVWNAEHIERVELLWEETLALEGRAGYYDRAGALKDVLQNHVLQVLTLIAMEPPASLEESDLRDAKVDVLRAVRPPSRSRRARYTAGRVGEHEVPSYVDEEGVDPARGTETFAEVVLELDSERWAGTEFVLRAGKALGHKRKGAFVRFRSPAGRPADSLWIGIEGPDDIRLTLAGRAVGPPPGLAQFDLSGEPPPSELPAYGQVLLDVLAGGCSLSVRGDEAEEAWRVMTPVLEAWSRGEVPLEEYAAGSAGPG